MKPHPSINPSQLERGELYSITYRDAAYFREDTTEEDILIPPTIVSIGLLRRVTKTFIDIGLTWTAPQKKYTKGIIVPINAVITLRLLKTTGGDKKKRKRKAVGVYWEDIQIYYDNNHYFPSQTYTEGTLVEDNAEFVVIKNPETVITSTSGEISNHPIEKPRFYYIPRALIKDIISYE